MGVKVAYGFERLRKSEKNAIKCSLFTSDLCYYGLLDNKFKEKQKLHQVLVDDGLR